MQRFSNLSVSVYEPCPEDRPLRSSKSVSRYGCEGGDKRDRVAYKDTKGAGHLGQHSLGFSKSHSALADPSVGARVLHYLVARLIVSMPPSWRPYSRFRAATSMAMPIPTPVPTPIATHAPMLIR